MCSGVGCDGGGGVGRMYATLQPAKARLVAAYNRLAQSPAYVTYHSHQNAMQSVPQTLAAAHS
eukprot:3425223-Amphidinium_carterae.1